LLGQILDVDIQKATANSLSGVVVTSEAVSTTTADSVAA
jgi:hypothetical protein